MRKSETLSINDLIRLCIKQNSKLEDGMDSVRIKSVWKEVTGEHISRATKDIHVSRKSLIVNIDSSILRSEVMLIRTQLVRKINQELGRDFISEIILR